LSRNARNTPLSLFVGRQRELQKLLIRIEGSLTGSRQAVAGRPGIGKTTLVEAVKAVARDAGYWVAPKSIALTPEAGSLDLLGQVLSGVYEAVKTACANASGPVVETAQQLVTSFRLHGGGLTVGALGFSGGGSRSEGVSQPPPAPCCWMGRGCSTICWVMPWRKGLGVYCCTSTTWKTSAQNMPGRQQTSCGPCGIKRWCWRACT
ncbi:MAG: ATP-binding protein, partial [Cyanobacteria bacterium MAG CAR4_bin_6]|nr:ATP-binding protein [Cyanobacteria bacterium MAG CAR4_bin_6]